MGFLRHIARLLSFLARWTRTLRFSRLKISVILLTGIVSGLSHAALIAAINELLGGERGVVVWTFIGLCALLPIARFSSGALVFHLSTNAVYEMRLQLCRKIASTSLRDLEKLGSHRLLGSLTNDIPMVTAALVALPAFLMQLFIVIGCLLFLAWLSPMALGGVLLFMLLGILSYRWPTRKALGLIIQVREGWDAVMDHYRSLIEGIKELKLNFERRQAFFDQGLEPVAADLQRKSFSSRSLFLGAQSWGQALFFITIGLLLLVLPEYQSLEQHVLSGYILALLYMMNPLNGVLDSLPVLANAAVAIGKIESLGLDLTPEAAELGEVVAPKPYPEWQALSLSGVTHSYHLEAEDRSFTLGPLNLTIPRGELLFITGGNGSGKTTLAKLLLGLYLPEDGEIQVDGEPVQDHNLEAYRQQFAVVFADFFLFNKLLGLETPTVDEQAEGYLRKLLLHHKVKVEDGVLSTIDLSQGQRKRLVLLTAYLEDRPVYLFDEWAADQDPEFKKVFYLQLLPELKARGKTVVVISHDDAYYHLADRLIKLDYGQILEDGVVAREVIPQPV